MARIHPSRSPALGAFALFAALAFALVRPAATDAGARRRAPPAAVLGDVSLDGALVREAGGWSVHVRAVNGATSARRCRLTAVVTERTDSPMSRVLSLPRPIWQAAVAVAVQGKGEAERRIALPGDVAGRLDAAPPKARAAGPRAPDLAAAETTITHGVSLHGACPADEPLG